MKPADRVEEAVSRARVIVPPLKNLPQRPEVRKWWNYALKGQQTVWSTHLSAEQKNAFKNSGSHQTLIDALRTFALYKQHATLLTLFDFNASITNVLPNQHRPGLDVVHQLGSCDESDVIHHRRVEYEGKLYQITDTASNILATYMSYYLKSSQRFFPLFVVCLYNKHITGLLFDKQNGTVEYFDSNGGSPADVGPLNPLCFKDIMDRLSLMFDKYMEGKSQHWYSVRMRQLLLPELGYHPGLCQDYTLAFFRMRVFENKTFEQTIDEFLDRSHMGTSKAVADQIFNSFFAKATKRRRRRRN